MRNHPFKLMLITTTLSISLVGCGGGGGGGGDVPAPTKGEVQVENQSSVDIWYVFLSPTTWDTWGEDQLESATIPPGGTFTMTDVDPGSWDLRLEPPSSSMYSPVEYYGFSVTAGQATVFTVTNETWTGSSVTGRSVVPVFGDS